MNDFSEINKNIQILNQTLSKQNSFKRAFLLSLLQGIGTAIGATLVAGGVIALFYRFVLSVDSIPLIQKLVPPSYIEGIVKSTK
ncbi:MAG: hypothetical protein US62_C0020G0017 [Candidatus Woesebacteria bacterium GW2011_GWA1_37_8]|uniref:Uncharacterized protein n=2 Tax=Candidatus Woeseibacteriota TaxID=1752722 RepID=A0A0G0NPK3_9BACT|nr:MAG: hypothetical protein US39_C0001G0211 [Microgenomates group bacterium GW2011_GWC1_37_12b]KKQ44964.1 MAG: hypothetical protein US62_C0020G0017 [Candidatus Woesebacteria bacterium GW2011_GWA1_37_8]KKQ87819.1 MAG: hypothetical protein UT10_C0001G0060 [Candidatus Woesebacteria bacterium GW2011_GWB1_38_8b]